MSTENLDEVEIRALVARWSKAVRDQDLAGIRADHDPDMLMFDVPPPFQSRGLDAYMATWDEFLGMQAKPVQFDFRDIAVPVGSPLYTNAMIPGLLSLGPRPACAVSAFRAAPFETGSRFLSVAELPFQRLAD